MLAPCRHQWKRTTFRSENVKSLTESTESDEEGGVQLPENNLVGKDELLRVGGEADALQSPPFRLLENLIGQDRLPHFSTRTGARQRAVK